MGSLAAEDSECSQVSCLVERPQPTKGDSRSPQSPAIRFSTRQRCRNMLQACCSTHYLIRAHPVRNLCDQCGSATLRICILFLLLVTDLSDYPCSLPTWTSRKGYWHC